MFGSVSIKVTWVRPLADLKPQKPIQFWKTPFEMPLITLVSNSFGPSWLCFGAQLGTGGFIAFKEWEMGNTESFT